MRKNLAKFHSDLQWQVQQAQRFPVLLPDEERRLAEHWRTTQDPAAAERLLGSHLWLVIKIARSFSGYGMQLDDLVAEGDVGLMQALRKFEPERGFRFATCAMWWIKAAIREYILRNRSVVRMGSTAGQKRLFFNLRRLKSRLGEVGDGDLEPGTVTRIASELAVSEAEVVDMNRRLSAADQSLSAPCAVGSDRRWEDALASEEDDQESVVAHASELVWGRELLADGMSTLSDRERHILAERRLKDELTTLQGLSQIYGVSRERVRQIEVRAFQKLQRAALGAVAKSGGYPHRPAA